MLSCLISTASTIECCLSHLVISSLKFYKRFYQEPKRVVQWRQAKEPYMVLFITFISSSESFNFCNGASLRLQYHTSITLLLDAFVAHSTLAEKLLNIYRKHKLYVAYHTLSSPLCYYGNVL